MKKALLIIIVVIATSHAEAQELPEYTASNGVTYKPGDNIKMGRGSGNSGDFVYLVMGGMAQQNVIHKNYAGRGVTLKRIKKFKSGGQDKVAFIVGGGNITNYNLFIEDAIATCEVEACNRQPVEAPDKFQKLKELKELLDSGALTQEEYDKEKQKILNP